MRVHAHAPERPPHTTTPQSRPPARPAVTDRPAAAAPRAEAGGTGVAPSIMQTAVPRLQRACACGGGCPRCRGGGHAARNPLTISSQREQQEREPDHAPAKVLEPERATAKVAEKAERRPAERAPRPRVRVPALPTPRVQRKCTTCTLKAPDIQSGNEDLGFVQPAEFMKQLAPLSPGAPGGGSPGRGGGLPPSRPVHEPLLAADFGVARARAEGLGQGRLFGGGRHAPDVGGEPRPHELTHFAPALGHAPGVPVRLYGERGPPEGDAPQSFPLPLSTPGDASELEADRVAEQIMRMPANADAAHKTDAATHADAATPSHAHAPSQSPASVQRRERGGGVPGAGPSSLPAAAQSILQPGGGSPLPDSVRAFMEPRFGADFGDVRLHTGLQAEQVTSQLQAQAFTYGRDIWLGAGESAFDLPLLAHELTHVLQQNPSFSRRARRGAQAPAQRERPARPTVQRAIDYWAPAPIPGMPAPGTRTHSVLEPSLGTANPGLFFEVNIPGGNRGTARMEDYWGERVLGRTDLYKSASTVENPQGTTIGVEFTDGDPSPRFLDKDPSLKLGRNTFNHLNKAAPAGKTNLPARGGQRVCPNVPTPGVCRLNTAPTGIKLGDIKPPSEHERRGGTQQLNNYITGINNVAGRVNAFAAANPGSAHPAGLTWTPNPQKMDSGDVSIPAQHDKTTYPNTAGRRQPVIRYVNGQPRNRDDVKLAFLYLSYDTSNPGIWYYEYVLPPSALPGAGAGGNLQQQQQAVTTSLQNNVITPVNTTPQQGATKRRPGGSPPARPPVLHAPVAPLVQRQQRRVVDNFRYAEWQAQYRQWRTQARPFLRSRVADQIEEIGVAMQVRQRTGIQQIPVAPNARELRAGLLRIRHWEDHGAIYGRLRQAFGSTYVKIIEFYERARTRFRERLAHRSEARGGARGSGLGGVVIRAAFDIIKRLAGFLLHQTTERLVSAVRSGAESVLRGFFGPEIEFVEEQVQRVNAFVAGIEEAAQREFLSVVEEIVGPFDRHLETIEAVRDVLGDIDRLINLVKWGVRIATCLTPPALGCLIGLLGTVVAEEIGERVAGSCWFKREIMLPLISGIGFVRELPNRIATFILDRVRALLPEQPPQIRQLLGEVPPQTGPANMPASDVACGGGDTLEVSAEHQALVRLYERHGEPTVDALIRALVHRGAGRGPGRLTLEVINQLELFLVSTGVTADDLRRFIAETPRRTSGSSTMEAELESIREWRYPTRPPVFPRPGVTTDVPRPRDQSPRRPETGITIIEF